MFRQRMFVIQRYKSAEKDENDVLLLFVQYKSSITVF